MPQIYPGKNDVTTIPLREPLFLKGRLNKLSNMLSFLHPDSMPLRLKAAAPATPVAEDSDLLLWHGYCLCKSGWSHKGLWWRNMSRRSAWRAGWGGHLPQTEHSNSNRLQFCDCPSLWFSIWFLSAPSLAKLCPPGKGGRFNLWALGGKG